MAGSPKFGLELEYTGGLEFGLELELGVRVENTGGGHDFNELEPLEPTFGK
jgi:hypothetical protein